MWTFLCIVAVCGTWLIGKFLDPPTTDGEAYAEAYAEAYKAYAFALRVWSQGDPIPVPPVRLGHPSHDA